jgi:hypothetical protein
MKRKKLIKALRRLSKVGFGYDLTAEDKEVLRQAAYEMEWLRVIIETYEEMLPPSQPGMLRKRLAERKAQEEGQADADQA